MNDVKKDPNMLATIRVALDIQTSATFIELVQKVAEIKATQVQDITVNSPATEGRAVDSIHHINNTLQGLKVLSDNGTMFPKLYMACVKNLFKPMVDSLTGIKQILNNKVLAHQTQQEVNAKALAAAKATEASSTLEESTLGEEPSAVTVLKTSKDGQLLPPEPPEGEAAKAYTRTTPKLTILNKFEFIKLIISTMPRNEWAVPEMITINEGAVLKALDESKRRTLPDCITIENHKTLVTKPKGKKKTKDKEKKA